MKQAHPDAEVIGLDGDQQVLEIARTKVAGTGLNINLNHKLAFDTSNADNTFDRVLSSLLFHHLTRENKSKVLKEVFRILRPGRELHIAAWGKTQNGLMRSAFLLVKILDGFETTADNVNGLLPALMGEVGFENVRETAQYATMFGSLSLYRTRKPG